jgi:hypothetical protein
MLFKRAPYFLGFVSLTLLSMVCSGRGQPGIAAHLSAQIATPQMVSEPAGAGRCVFCHRAEVEGYARSAMAHSLRTAGQEPDGAVDTPDAKITMHSSTTGYWQRLQSGGDVSNYRIDYVIGSGNHASGYLVDLAGHLFQSPVAFYKTRNEYDLAPGYEGLPNPDFTRPVAEGCLFCHSGSVLQTSTVLRPSPRKPSPASVAMVRPKDISAIHELAPSSTPENLPPRLVTASASSVIYLGSAEC